MISMQLTPPGQAPDHYSEEEMVQIIRIRATTEGLSIDDDAVTVLGKIGTNATLICCLGIT